MSKFYHFSREIDKDIEEFIPKVPNSKAHNEDSSIKRVCISKLYEDCLSSINYVLDKDCYDTELNEYKPIKVYEFELNEEDVVHPKEVFKYVPDALIHNEYWSLNPIKPIRSFIVKPTYIAMSRTEPYTVTTIGMLEFDIVE